MRYREIGYSKFLNLLQDKYIVCVGLGKLFERYKLFFKEKGLYEKVLALVDNDERKYGMKVDLAGKVFSVRNLDDLVSMRQNYKFIVLVISAYYQEICNQIESREELCDLEVIDALYMVKGKDSYQAAYTNLFQDTFKGIGNQGENMTISVLMHNRVELTVRLLDSIKKFMPEFSGEIVIGDNGSDEEELYVLKNKLKEIDYNYRIIKFNTHYPIPVGKNKLNKECQTDWILQLDNDIYFTGNPIRKMDEDIRALGCKLWGLPYYDMKSKRVANYGSNLEFRWMDNGKKELECLVDLPFRESERQWAPMFCTYAAGGAALMDKGLFFALGGYDKNLFVYEDIDFMYRANMQGYKIGNIGMKCLVHDHKQIDSELGGAYEAIRFDKSRMRMSKKYLQDKHGCAFD